jgi:hypothetical protein
LLGVTVDPLRPEEDLEVAEQMAEDEEDQNDADTPRSSGVFAGLDGLL